MKFVKICFSPYNTFIFLRAPFRVHAGCDSLKLQRSLELRESAAAKEEKKVVHFPLHPAAQWKKSQLAIYEQTKERRKVPTLPHLKNIKRSENICSMDVYAWSEHSRARQ